MRLVPKIIGHFLWCSSLAHLVPMQKSKGHTQGQARIATRVDGDVAKWCHNGRSFTYVCERTCEGSMFVEVSTSASAPLIYSVRDAVRLSPSIEKEAGHLDMDQ